MWLENFKKQFFILMFFLRQKTCENTNEIAVENEQFNLRFDLNDFPYNNVNVNAPHSVIAKCDISKNECTSFRTNLAKATINKTVSRTILEVQIKSIGRSEKLNSEGNWSLSPEKIESGRNYLSITLVVVSKPPENVRCTGKIWNCAVTMTCWIKVIYPKAKCIFGSNQSKAHSKMLEYKNVYKHDIIDKKSVLYYETNCTIIIPFTKVIDGLDSLFVSIFPGNSNPTYGTKKTISITDENYRKWCGPAIEGEENSIKIDVPKYTEGKLGIDNQVSTISECDLTTQECSKTRSFTNITLKARDDHLEIILTFSATSRKNIQGNWTVKVQGSQEITSTYFVKVLYRARNVSCSDYPPSLICLTETIYPQAKCTFMTEFTKINSNSTDFVQCNSTQIQGRDLYYKCRCELSFGESQRLIDVNINITIFPNVTGDDDYDERFGTSLTIIRVTPPPGTMSTAKTNPSLEYTTTGRGLRSSFHILRISWFLAGAQALHILINLLIY